MRQVVARFDDGRVVKGVTLDFSPEKILFHVDALNGSAPETSTPIHTTDLKALFFVRDLMGDPLHVEDKQFHSPPSRDVRRIRAAFRDGEVLVGTSTDYEPGIPGFFLVPADRKSNNERCYVVAAATEEVRFV